MFLLAAKNRGIQFTTDEAPGAWPNESRVRKAIDRVGDAHPVGSLATVVGSTGPVPARIGLGGNRLCSEGPIQKGVFGYFVFWDEPPADSVPCFVAGNALELVPPSPPSWT